MNSLIQEQLVRETWHDHERAASRAARLRVVKEARDEVRIRHAGEADAERLRRLAELDSARVPTGPTLVAEHDGMLLAALPLAGGRPLADPFVPSADFVKLLELRASQLRRVV
jgi:hypothetical protein